MQEWPTPHPDTSWSSSGQELRAKDLGKPGKGHGSRVQVQLRQRGFVSLCKSERGTAGCFYLQGLCGVGCYHAIAWYDLITISGAH